jgi:hypothetical protein
MLISKKILLSGCFILQRRCPCDTPSMADAFDHLAWLSLCLAEPLYDDVCTMCGDRVLSSLVAARLSTSVGEPMSSMVEWPR